MANLDAPRGFQLVGSGGAAYTRRVPRPVGATCATPFAPGDAYTIDTDGTAIRVTGGTQVVNGIVESIEVKAKSGEGSESLDYLPINTAASLIGIEDFNAEFEAQIDTVAAADFDAAALVDVADTAPNATLRQSRQEVTLTSGSQMRLVRLVDRVDNVVGTDAKVIVRLLTASVL